MVDIAIQVVGGCGHHRASSSPALATLDSVDRNDKDFGTSFPYLALPHVDAVNRGVDRSPRSPEFIGVNPERILDTRYRHQADRRLDDHAAGDRRRPTLGVPRDASTVYLNITTDGTAGPNGYVTVYPCDAPRPVASNFNPIAGQRRQRCSSRRS